MASVKKAQVVITANASVAKRVMEELDKAAQRAAQRMKSLAAQGKQNTKEFKAAEKEFQAFNSAMRENVKDTQRVQEVMKNLAGTATRDLRRALQAAKRELDKMSARDPKRQQLIDDMKAIQQQIDKNTGSLKKFGATHNSVWQTAVRNITAYMGVFALFSKAKQMFTDYIQKNREFSDQLANIRKVSNLAMQDINELATRLAKIDTRSSIQELNNLAYAGSKLGFGEYGIEGLEGFVKSAVKVQNALKEDMGEDAMTQLSKMVEVMGLIPKMGVERAMDATGSAIFKLASTSTATGTNIVEFSKRLMGLANQAHITTPELLAFGSAADSMALMPEVAATAFNKLITAVQKQPNLIEKALNIPKGTISDLYQAGQMTEALVTIFEKMREKGGMNALMHSGVFKDLGSDGARLVAVMATMSNRVDILQKHLQTANEAFSDGTAVAQEYAIQMDTAAAYAERAANIWEKSFINPEGVDVVKEFSKAWYDVSKSMTQSELTMFSLRSALKGILYILMGIIRILPDLAIAALIGGVSSIIVKLKEMNGVLGLLTASFKKMTAAQKAFWTTTGYVALALAIYEVGKAIYDLSKKEQEASMYMKGFKKDLSDLETQFGASREELDRYRAAIDKATVGTKQRVAAIREFNNKFGQYMSNMLSEKSTAQDIANAYNQVVKAMRTKLALQLKEKDIQEQVLPREQWSAQKREDYVNSVKGTKYSQYGREWISGYAEDTKGWSMDKVASDLGRIFGLNTKEIEHIRKNWRREHLPTYHIQSYDPMTPDVTYEARNAEKSAFLAMRYLAQSRSATNAYNKVNEKWAPEQKNMEEMLAKEDENLDPLADARDKAAERAAAKAERERRKHEREAKAATIKEFEHVKEQSTALIKDVESYYNMQAESINQLARDGEITSADMKALLKDLEERRDRALSEARLAIAGEKNDFDNIRNNEMGIDKDMYNFSELSQKTLDDIRSVDLAAAYKKLASFDGSEGVYGVNSGAFLDEIKAKATAYKKKQAELEAERINTINKILESYDLLDKLSADTAESFIKLGLFVTDFEQGAMSARLRAQKAGKIAKVSTAESEPIGNFWKEEDLSNVNVESKAKTHSNPFEAMLKQFAANGAKPFTVDISKDSDLAQWLIDFASNYTKDEEGDPVLTEWAKQNNQVKDWFLSLTGVRRDFATGEFDKEDLKAAMDPIRNNIQMLYSSLIDWEEKYYLKLKEIHDRDKKIFTEMWARSGAGEAFSDAQKELSLMKRRQALTGDDKGTSFGQMAGWSNLQSDPEIAASMLRMEQARQELELMKQISNDKRLIREQEQALDEAAMALQEQIMAKINERIGKIQEWTAPIEQFGSEVGAALGEVFKETDNFADNINQALKKVVESWGQSTIKIVKELLMQELRQRMIRKAMAKNEKKAQGEMTETAEEGGAARLAVETVTEQGVAAITQKAGQMILSTKQDQTQQEMQLEGAKAQGKVAAGTAEAASTTLGSLGWWGIPLIAVITALLNGLLSMALNAIFGSGKNSTSTPKTNTKLKSGMLTYDEGNVQSVVGNDGHVYRAHQQSMPSGTALVSSPIATTVNGQPALVAERGPEIVIGRRTTRHIMMNEPGLLQHLAQIDRNRSAARYHTFDDGNIGGISEYSEYSDYSERANALTADDARALAAAITVFQQTVAQLQQKGIPAHIKKFGTGGLIEEVKSGLKFDQRYNRS